jgi:hypothetical protein
MAKLIDTETRIVPTWLAAARFLKNSQEKTSLNILLEIPDPLTITADDRVVMKKVDVALAASELTLNTVAGTIFPLDLYKRHGRPDFYSEYLQMLDRGKAHGTWGTYAARMINRQGSKRGGTINPLEMIVEKLTTSGQPRNPNGSPKTFPSTYELGVSDPSVDLAEGDLPTYNAANDGRRWYGYPCLSHVSFKRVPVDGGYAVNLTAVYRSHTYCSRALGNLLGLAQLLSFVAKESGLKVGTLSCLSSYAQLDVNAWGGVKATNSVLA